MFTPDQRRRVIPTTSMCRADMQNMLAEIFRSVPLSVSIRFDHFQRVANGMSNGLIHIDKRQIVCVLRRSPI